MSEHRIGYSHGHGFFDTVAIEGSGLIRLEGWHTSSHLQNIPLTQCLVNQQEVPIFQTFRVYRPDVAVMQQSDDFFLGFVCLYQLEARLVGTNATLELVFDGQVIFEARCMFHTSVPAYDHLFDTAEVLHRQHIYGFGPPSMFINDEVVHLAKLLPGPVLDFGCGSGVLVKHLRSQGIEAYGIELEREPILQSIPPEVREYIRLYDGSFPLPFEDNSFRSAIATEVIEHVPDYEAALHEISRVVTEMCIITVPDIMSIPICHHNNVVPWHLLEATHLNFFTQRSLERSLKAYFSNVKMLKIAPTITNDTKWFGCLAAICQK
jgi:2-polyprenyl-3-methyl-5-hydroxy-6-metoxy-1,4-benzoquinol methylase